MRVPHVLVLVPGLGSVRNHAYDRDRDRVRDLNHLVQLLQTPQLRVQDEDRTVLLLVELVQIGYTDAGNIPVLRVVIGLSRLQAINLMLRPFHLSSRDLPNTSHQNDSAASHSILRKTILPLEMSKVTSGCGIA